MPENNSVEAASAMKSGLVEDMSKLATELNAITSASQQAIGVIKEVGSSFAGALGVSKEFSNVLGAIDSAIGIVAGSCQKLLQIPQQISDFAETFKSFGDAIGTAQNAVQLLTTSTQVSMAVEKAHQAIIMIKNGEAAKQVALINQNIIAKVKDKVATLGSIVAEKASALATGISTGAITLQTIATAAGTVATNAFAFAAGILKVALTALSGPVGWIIVGIGALAGGIIALIAHLTTSTAAFEESKAELEELNAANEELNGSLTESAGAFKDNMSAAKGSAAASETLLDNVMELASKENRTAEETAKLKSRIETLNGTQEGLNLTLDETTGALSMTESEIQNYIAASEKAAQQDAVVDRMGELAGELADVETQYQAAQAAQSGYDQMLASGQLKRGEYNDLMRESSETLENLGATKNRVTAEMTALESDYTAALEEKAAIEKALMEEEEAAIQSFADQWGLSFEEIKAGMAENGQNFEEWKADNITGLEENKAALEGYAAQWGVTTEEIMARCEAQGITFQELAETQQAAIGRLKEFYGSLADSATEMFSRIDTSSELSITDMTDNLLHNQEAVAQWSENIATLAEMGIDDGLLQTLMEAGPESAGYVQEIVSSSEDEIMKLSDAYAAGGDTANDALKTSLGNADISPEIMGLVSQAESSLYAQVGEADFLGIGQSVGEGLAKGITDSQSQVTDGMQAVTDATTDTAKTGFQVNSPSLVFADIGNSVDEGLAQGITENLGVVKTAANEVVGAMNIRDALVKSGQNAIDGFISGMSGSAWKAYLTASLIAVKVLETVNNILGIRSPSRKLRETGQYTMEGFELGMQDKEKDIFSTVRGIAGMVTNEMQGLAGSASGIDAVYSGSVNIHDNAQTGLLEKLLSAVQQGKVIQLDTGALVGATAGAYDVSLGNTKRYSERWRR